MSGGATVPQAPAQGGAALRHIAEPLRPLAVPITDLTPDAANARKHDERNLDAIAASLSRWGQRLPIVVQRRGMVVRAGNGRVEAAKRLGWTHIAAVVVDDDSVEAVAFAIADNRTAELATWDDQTLASLLDTLPKDARDAAGWSDAELSDLLESLTPAEVVEDEAPEPLAEAVSRTGDLWHMGAHRLLCGDSTKAEDVGRVMGDTRPSLMLTDPPYGVAYQTKLSVEEATARRRRTDGLEVANDALTPDATRALVAAALGEGGRRLRPGGAFYVCSPSGDMSDVMRTAVVDAGLRYRQVIIWVKDVFVMGRQDYHWRHEDILYGWVEGAAHYFVDDRTQDTVWECPRPKRSEEHPTMKPAELFGRAIGNSTRAGDAVYEPFSGSGTTLVASEQLGRTCYAIELEPRYVDVAIRRWQKLTGREATLGDGGPTFAQVAQERGVAP
jgi:DNA modification methylase